MKMTSIIKTVVAVTAIVTVGKVVYDKVKANKEAESEEVKTTIDEVVEDDEPEPKKNIIEKAVDKFNNLSTDDQALVVTVAGAVVIGLGVMFVGNHIIDRRYNRSLANYKSSQEYKNLRNNALNDYMNSKNYQDDIERFTRQLTDSMIPTSIDKYVSKFMMRELADYPGDYECYLDNKLSINLLNSCYLCKILDEKLITPEQFDHIAGIVVNELNKDVYQEVK